MKKVILLVALFLVGTTTQTFANHQDNVERNPYIKNGCNHSETIQFVEEGVIYTIATDGSFQYDVLKTPNAYRRNGKHKKFNKRRLKHIKRRHYRPYITTDRWGRIRAINDTYITYKKNGKVKTIGNVPLYYQRGRLTQVGNMKLVYNRFGDVRNTIGHVNKFNKKFWHDDWYVYNDRNNDDDRNGLRRRTK